MLTAHRSGLIVSLITPFLPNGHLDDTALRRQAKRMVKHNAAGLLVGDIINGHAVLTEHDQLHALGTLADELQQSTSLWAMVSDPILRSASAWAKKCGLCGASTLLVNLPRLNMRQNNGLQRYLATLREVSQCDLVVSLDAGQYATFLDSLNRLAEDDVVHGLIDGGHPSDTRFLVEQRSSKLKLYAASDENCLNQLSQGFEGLISTRANAQPEIWEAFWTGLEADDWNQVHQAYISAMQLGSQRSDVRDRLASEGWIYPTTADNLGLLGLEPQFEALLEEAAA